VLGRLKNVKHGTVSRQERFGYQDPESAYDYDMFQSIGVLAVDALARLTVTCLRSVSLRFSMLQCSRTRRAVLGQS
jgi:hypothetical protein